MILCRYFFKKLNIYFDSQRQNNLEDDNYAENIKYEYNYINYRLGVVCIMS